MSILELSNNGIFSVGSYVCSDIPGEFVWQPGVVTTAAMKGYWLLIEDIDKVLKLVLNIFFCFYCIFMADSVRGS